MNNFNDPIFKELTETYRQINELYHGNVSDCMKQCKEVHSHLSEEQCRDQYCKESMTTQGNVQESHSREELEKLSNDKLAELKAEYAKKAKDAEGEEKEHHEKELADIESIMASRKDDKKETKQIDELSKKTLGSYVKLAAFDVGRKSVEAENSAPGTSRNQLAKIGQRKRGIEQAVSRLTKEDVEQIDELDTKTKLSYYLKSIHNQSKLKDKLDTVEDDIHDFVQDVASHPDSGMNVNTAHHSLPHIPGGDKLAKERDALKAKIAQRKQGQARVEKTTGIMPQNEDVSRAGQEALAKDVVEKGKKIRSFMDRINKKKEKGK